MIAGYTEAHFDLVLHQRKRRRSRAASGVIIPAVSQLPDHLCCVNSKAVSEEPSTGLRAGELPVVFNLV